MLAGQRTGSAVIEGIFQIDSSDAIDGIDPEMGAIGTAPAIASCSQVRVALSHDHPDAQALIYHFVHKFRCKLGSRHPTDPGCIQNPTVFGHTLILQHLGKLDIVIQGRDQAGTTQGMGDRYAVDHAPRCCFRKDAAAILITVHTNHSGPLVCIGGQK